MALIFLAALLTERCFCTNAPIPSTTATFVVELVRDGTPVVQELTTSAYQHFGGVASSLRRFYNLPDTTAVMVYDRASESYRHAEEFPGEEQLPAGRIEVFLLPGDTCNAAPEPSGGFAALHDEQPLAALITDTGPSEDLRQEIWSSRGMVRDTVTVVLTAYKRPHLSEQLERLLAQTHLPAEIYVWQNGNYTDVNSARRRFPSVRFLRSDHNFKFHGKLALGLLLDSEYVVFMDDDVMPNRRWIEATLRVCKARHAVVGTRGWILQDGGAVLRVGTYPMRHDMEVDWVGHTWFLRTEWLRHLWSEPQISWDTGDDVALCAALKIRGGIRSVVAAAPLADTSVWGDAQRLGIDAVAHHRDPAFRALRDRVEGYWVRRGWRRNTIERYPWLRSNQSSWFVDPVPPFGTTCGA